MGRWRAGGIVLVASVSFGLLGGQLPFGTHVADAQTGELGGLQRGALYASPESADQRVRLSVLGEAPGGGAMVSVSLDLSCDGSTAQGDEVAEVDGRGAIDVEARLLGDVEEDISVVGTAALHGQVQADGTVAGTVDVSLVTKFEHPDHCTARAAPWAAAPRPDPALARIEAFVPLTTQLAELRGASGGLAFGDGALFWASPRAKTTTLVRIDPATAAVAWQVEVADTGLSPAAVFGQGLVWITDVRGSDGDVIRAFDPSDGKRIASVKGSAIAFAPDGTGWTVRDKGKTLRKVDPETHRVSGEYPMPKRLAPQVAASNDAVYVQVRKNRFDIVITRLDPATHGTTAESDPQSGDSDMRVDATALWSAGGSGVSRLDPITLDQLGADEEGQYYLSGVLTAAPGLWLDDGGIFIYDEQLGLTTGPPLTGPLATDGTSVWVLDASAGIARLKAG
jgi:hypothetical protein